MIYVTVQPNESIDSALKRFNMKLQQSGLLRELKEQQAGGVVLIEGEAGIGKSRLVAWLGDRAQELGITTWALTGRPLNPLMEAVDDAVVVDAPYTATVQEVHQIVVHLLCAAVDVAAGVASPLLEVSER